MPIRPPSEPPRPAAKLRVGFAGTPPFAATALAAVLSAGFEVVAVMTRPDQRQGRGLKLAPSAVKLLALERGLTLLQPETLRDEGTNDIVSGLGLDVLLVAAYGLILPQRGLRTDPAATGARSPSAWMHQHSRLAAAQVAGSGADPACAACGRRPDRDQHHADGCGPGYGRADLDPCDRHPRARHDGDPHRQARGPPAPRRS